MLLDFFGETSLNKLKEIDDNMEGVAFHWQSHILYDIRTYFGPKKINYLEIGVAYGMTAALVASHPFPTECYLLDLGYPDGIVEIAKKNIDTFKNPSSCYNFYVGNSRHEDVKDKIRQHGQIFDFIFIDGDHFREGVLSDFLTVESLLKPGGVLVFDDYLDREFCPEVGPAIDDIVKEHGDKFNILGSVYYDAFPKCLLNPKYLDYTHNFNTSNLFVMIKK